jgi:hypothetical protein
MKAHELTFQKRNWTGEFDRSCVHFAIHSQFSTILNHFGQSGYPAFTGRRAVRLVQGVTITPPTRYDIAPFMVYATNHYGRNQSLSHTGSARFDVVEVMDTSGLPTYRLVLAIFEVEGLGCHYIGAELELAHKRLQDKLMPYELFQIMKVPRTKLLQITCFETRNILRPACFVPTTETNSSYKRWCKNTQFDVGKPVFFWCFPYRYCDRSRWNTISTSDKEYFNIPRDVRDTIAKLANIGDNKEESDDEDSTDSSNEQDDI